MALPPWGRTEELGGAKDEELGWWRRKASDNFLLPAAVTAGSGDAPAACGVVVGSRRQHLGH